ncbi:MAG: PAS domain-containing protein, partial [Gemmatimonadales bacterium]|nr:PAS domain-containing protein [Gemmatimonadales bacterium]
TDGVLIHANPSFAKIWGYQNEAEVIGKPINNFLAGEEISLEIIESIKASGKWDGEFTAVRKDGSTFRAQASANSVHDTEGNTVALYSSVFDVTEIRNSEEMLSESNDMISSTPAVALRWRNAEGWPVEYVSDNVKNLLGYTAEEFLSGKVAYSEIIHPEDLEVFGIEVAKYSSDKKARGFSHDPYRVITKDGETKWIADRTNFRRDENGEITHFRGIVLDITEQRNIQEERKRLENSLYQSDKMASIGQLSAGVAHEINNPIGFISSNLNTMKEYLQELTELFNGNELESSENREQIDELIIDFGEAISESQEGAERVKNIVADMKGFSRADSVEMEATNLNDGLTSTLNIVWNQLKYNCKVEKELGDIPEVECFPSKINQVFLNLLVNAGHAIEGDSGLITIKTWAADGNVHVSIRDNGCGIPKENLPKLFDAFFTTKEVGKGTGLGLNLSHDIISNHGGTISVTSELGKGTEFEVALPFEEIREPILIPLD